MAGYKPNSGERDPFNIVRGIRELFEGRSHAVGQITLTLNQVTTVVPAPNCGESSVVKLVPRNASAAAEIGNGTLFVSAVAPGRFTLTHASNGLTRIFDYALQG